MNEPLRIAALGLTHDHVWGLLRDLREQSGATLVAAGDPHTELLERAAREYGCAVDSDPRRLIDQAALDAVIVCADNAGGADLAAQAAGRGLAVLVEKPMAADLAGADRMLAAARSAGVPLMVNWPFAWWPQMQHAFALVEQGAIGRLWQVKYRSSHEGPRELGCSPQFCDWLYDARRNGAGAFMDYCCYGAALARALLGLPSRVFGAAGRFVKEDILVDDNGLLVMTYPGALAISEGSWTQVGHLTSYVASIYGTRGQLLIEPRVGGKLWLATADEPEGVEVPVPPLPSERRSALAHFLHVCHTEEAPWGLCDPRISRDAQEILAAGLLSAQRGSEVSLPLPCVV